MSFDFSTLVTDRSQGDLEALRSLLSTPMADWTAEQMEKFNQAVFKGSYNYTDLNRVTACMDYLNEILTATGYVTGYHSIIVHPSSKETANSIPDGYTELEYIQNSESSYIDTEISGLYKATFDIKFGASNSRILMGQGSGVGQYFGKDADNRPELGGGVFINYDFSQRTTAIFEKTSSFAQLTVNNTTVQRSSSTTTAHFYLFRTNSDDWYNFSGEITFYGAKFEQNGNTVLNLIPCKNESGIIGVYDTINNRFFTNDGEGELLAGPIIPTPEPLDPYSWYEDDTLLFTQMKRYLQNLESLRNVLNLPEDTAQAPENMVGLTLEEANNIESILGVLQNWLINMKEACFFSRDLYSGEV